MQPDGTGLTAVFPCKPTSHARALVLGGAERRMTLYACRSLERTYALGWIDVDVPPQVEPILVALAAAARRNIGAGESAGEALPWQVVGATPQAVAARWQLVGLLPDGRKVQQQVAVFARGLRVYQASVVASEIDPADAQQFFDGLRWRP
jgi:hypothetical protein